MLRATLFYLLVVWMSVTSCLAQTQTPSSTPSETDPAVIFGRLRDYLDNNPLDFKTSFVVGGDAPFRGSMQFFIQRPNLFRVESTIAHRSYVIVSDGQVMTIYVPKDKKFAQLPAPARPASALRIGAGLMGLESKVLEFIDVVDDIAAGRKDLRVSAAGSETIAGKQCDGFTVVDATVAVTNTWKVWLQKSQIPLPCKLETRSSDFLSTQTNEFSWKQPAPAFARDTFVFTPPPGGENVSVGDLGLSAP